MESDDERREPHAPAAIVIAPRTSGVDYLADRHSADRKDRNARDVVQPRNTFLCERTHKRRSRAELTTDWEVVHRL
jgi:hypothetical protein